MHTEINHLGPSPIPLKKRVLFVITQSEMGGAQKFLLTLINRLDKTKYKLLVAAGPLPKYQDPLLANELFNQLAQEGVELKKLKHLQREVRLLTDWQAIWEIRKVIKEFGPETIFLLSSKAGFIGSLASIFPSRLRTKNYQPKTIYRIGGWSFNDPWPWWKKKLWIILEKFSANWKDLIIVNNRHDWEQARRLKICPAEKMILIPNGIDPYRLKLLNKEEAKIKLFEKAAKISSKVFQAITVVGTIANLYPAKGLKYLVEAADQLKNTKGLIFLIIGDGPERESLEKLIETKNLKNKIFILGQWENASQYLPVFDIFVLPSIKEGFPWVILEAMAAKLPIIAASVGAIPEIIENGKNGLLVEPAHPEQIVQKIQELMEDHHLKQELILQAHQTVLFKFPLEKMVKEIEMTF